MNKLFIGTKFKEFLEREISKDNLGALYIAGDLPPMPRKLSYQRLNIPKQDPRYLKARQLAELLYANTPNGDTTLTVRNGKRAILTALYEAKPRKTPQTDNEEATAMFEDLMASPVLSLVLDLKNARTTFEFRKDAVVLARLNRAELGDFDANTIAAFLIAQHDGQVIADASYLKDAHVNLAHTDRLILGAPSLESLPPRLRDTALLMSDVQGHGALYRDAVVLAEQAGLRPDPARDDNDYNRFIEKAMEG